MLLNNEDAKPISITVVNTPIIARDGLKSAPGQLCGSKLHDGRFG